MICSGLLVLTLLILLILTAIILHAFQPLNSPHPLSSHTTTPHLLTSPPPPHLTPSPSSSLLPSLSSYSLLFADEFDQPDGSPPSPSHWNSELGCGLYNGELQCYTASPRNAHIRNGRLVITALHEATEVVTEVKETVRVQANASAHQAERVHERNVEYRRWFNFTSARLTTQGKLDVAFPRVQASIRLPQSLGVWPALWLLGSSIDEVGWPRCGEVDVLEAVNDEGLVHSSLHWNRHGLQSSNVSHRQQSASYLPASPLSDWRLYEVAMEEERIVFALDGEVFYSVDLRGRPELDAFSGGRRQPFFLILNLAVGGWWPGWEVDVHAMPATMEVEFVRVYQRRE